MGGLANMPSSIHHAGATRQTGETWPEIWCHLYGNTSESRHLDTSMINASDKTAPAASRSRSPPPPPPFLFREFFQKPNLPLIGRFTDQPLIYINSKHEFEVREKIWKKCPSWSEGDSGEREAWKRRRPLILRSFCAGDEIEIGFGVDSGRNYVSRHTSRIHRKLGPGQAVWRAHFNY